MASSQFLMHRYLVDRKMGLMVNLAICAAEYIKRYGVTPTVAHVSKLLRDVPPQIGPIRIEQAWGVFPHEIDLGVEPIAAPTIHELPVAMVAERKPEEAQ